MPEELSQIHICLFKNVSNAKAIKASLIAASSMDGPGGDEEREKYDFCFVEGKTVSPIRRLHLVTKSIERRRRRNELLHSPRPRPLFPPRSSLDFTSSPASTKLSSPLLVGH